MAGIVCYLNGQAKQVTKDGQFIHVCGSLVLRTQIPLYLKNYKKLTLKLVHVIAVFKGNCKILHSASQNILVSSVKRLYNFLLNCDQISWINKSL